jgi:hypothetical protein
MNISIFISTVRKFFAPLPHIPQDILRPFVPFLSWYVLLRGLLKIIDGFRDVSAGLHYGSLPRMFTTLLDVHPGFFLLAGILSVIAGVLYVMTFAPLAEESRRRAGFERWVTAALILTVAKLIEVIFIGQSSVGFLISTVVGWYLIFEFGALLSPTMRVAQSVRRKAAGRKRRSR